jgi:hypothetical protein
MLLASKISSSQSDLLAMYCQNLRPAPSTQYEEQGIHLIVGVETREPPPFGRLFGDFCRTEFLTKV